MSVFRQSFARQRFVCRLTILRLLLMASSGIVHVTTLQVGTSASAADAFAFKLYSALRETEGNILLSPISLDNALTVVYAGARGQTAAEMARVMDLPEPRAAVADLAALNRGIREWNNEGSQLLLLTRVWTQRNEAISAEYQGLIREELDSEIVPADFINRSEHVRGEINAWVEEQTEREIREFLEPQAIDNRTRLVVANILTLDQLWASPFKQRDTLSAPFHSADHGEVKIPTMVQRHRFRVGHTADVDVIELPYAGEHGFMLIALPRRPSDFERVDAAFTASAIASWREALNPVDVVVYLPKFKATWQQELSDPLRHIGMREVFASNADLSGIARSPLMLSKVFQRVSLTLNEEGTEAKAASGAVAQLRIGAEAFVVNRPFLFLVMDRATNAILLMGRIKNL